MRTVQPRWSPLQNIRDKHGDVPILWALCVPRFDASPEDTSAKTGKGRLQGGELGPRP